MSGAVVPDRRSGGVALRFVLPTLVLLAVTATLADRLWQALAWIAVTAFAVPLSIFDFRTLRLPNPLVLAAFASAALLLAVDAGLAGMWPSYARAWVGAVVLSAFFYALRVLSKGGMGLGDVKLAAVVGLVLAYQGWTHLYIGAFLGFLLGAIYGVGLIIFSSGGRKTKVPFGPFMLAGAWLGLWVTPWFEKWLLPW